MTKGKNKSIFFTVLFFLGLLLALQFRTILKSSLLPSDSTDLVKDIMDQVEAEKKIGKELRSKLRELQDYKDAYIKSLKTDPADFALNKLYEELKRAKLLAGLTPVKGPGIILRLNDAPARKDMDPNDLIIHDSDIMLLLNDLKAAGAQAISIEGERIIATSKQICAGPTILINNTRHAVPYEIKAIGDPDKMLSALEESRAVIIMRIYNIQVDIEKKKEIVIDRYQIINSEHMFKGLEVVR